MKRVWPWFLSLSRSIQIAVCVALTHLIAIAALLINHAASSHLKAKAPIAIRTALTPRKEIAYASPPQGAKQAPEQAPKPAPKVAPEPEKKVAPPSVEKKPAAAPKPPIQTKSGKTSNQKKSEPAPQANKQTTDAVESSLLKELADILDALTAQKPPSPPSKFQISLPQSIEMSKNVIERSLSSDPPEYGQVVSAILQNTLDLPEFGQVVARIEIDANGTVVSSEILDERSRKNGQFLKKRLQELTFPCFNEFGLSEKRLIFTVTFRNVENH